jgi:hypothetical protein
MRKTGKILIALTALLTFGLVVGKEFPGLTLSRARSAHRDSNGAKLHKTRANRGVRGGSTEEPSSIASSPVAEPEPDTILQDLSIYKHTLYSNIAHTSAHWMPVTDCLESFQVDSSKM